MKRTVVLMLFAIILSASLFSQAIQYEIKVKYKNSSSGITADITVLVKKGESPFAYFLMTNDPVKGKILMKSESSSGKSYVFKGVKPGKYFIRIEDKMGLPAGKTVEITENENGKN
jgi:hypothetical protein